MLAISKNILMGMASAAALAAIQYLVDNSTTITGPLGAAAIGMFAHYLRSPFNR